MDNSPVVIGRLRELVCELDEVDFIGNADSVPGAMELLFSLTPDVVFVDLHLGDYGMNGIDLVQMIRLAFPGMIVIVLTNLSGQLYQRWCTDKGAHFFLDKSNDFERIPDTLREIFNRTRAAASSIPLM